MKTKELIELLQRADPDGNIDVTIGNAPISYVDRLPAYYDGRLQRILYDTDNVPIVGILCSGGDKLVIHYRSISDCLSDNPFMTVIREGGELQDHDKSWIELERKESVKITHDVYVKYKKD
jgi:hypothetical protein